MLELKLFQKRKGMSLKRQVEKGCELKRIEFKPKVFQNRKRKAGTKLLLYEFRLYTTTVEFLFTISRKVLIISYIL